MGAEANGDDSLPARTFFSEVSSFLSLFTFTFLDGTRKQKRDDLEGWIYKVCDQNAW